MPTHIFPAVIAAVAAAVATAEAAHNCVGDEQIRLSGWLAATAMINEPDGGGDQGGVFVANAFPTTLPSPSLAPPPHEPSSR